MTTSAMVFAPPRPALRSWQLLALVIALNLIVLWFSNEYVLTRETYQRLLSDRLEASRVDEYFDFARRLRIWGYVLTPPVVVVRVGFMALALQLALLLLLIEVPIGRLFRLALWAFLALLAGTAVRDAFLATLDPADERRFRANEKGWIFFNTRPPSYRRTATWWVVSAKKPETRERRLDTLIADSARGMKIGPLRRP